MKKLLFALSLIAAFTLNAQTTQHKEPHQASTKKEVKTTSKKQAQNGKVKKISDDSYLDDYKDLNLTQAQKNKIKALHKRRIEKYPKMKNSKQGLNEKQYQQEVYKVLTKDQKTRMDKKSNVKKTHETHATEIRK